MLGRLPHGEGTQPTRRPNLFWPFLPVTRFTPLDAWRTGPAPSIQIAQVCTASPASATHDLLTPVWRVIRAQYAWGCPLDTQGTRASKAFSLNAAGSRSSARPRAPREPCRRAASPPGVHAREGPPLAYRAGRAPAARPWRERQPLRLAGVARSSGLLHRPSMAQTLRARRVPTRSYTPGNARQSPIMPVARQSGAPAEGEAAWQ